VGETLGTILGGRYRLEALLGRGAMGEVYRAQDLKLGQVVALKFLPAAIANSESARQRFISEVKLGRQVSHPNVCRVYDLTEVDGRHALSMEYIDGEDLASRIARRGAMSKVELLKLAAELCAGLGAAHDRGVVHRDLKPANILIDRDGGAHIADFGIAALATETRARDYSGTLVYMAPEQIAGEAASARSDLFGMGLALYEAATGRRRFSARTLEELKAQHSLGEAVQRDALRNVPAPVFRLINDCLKENPEGRPANAQAAAALLGNESWLPRPRQLAAVLLMLLVVLAGAGWLAMKRGWIAAGVAAGAPARLGPASAAVLPFENLSGVKGDEYLSDGMSDTLLDRLSQVPQLRIVARTSSFAFKGKSASAAEIGAALGVAALVEGSVQRQGDELRIGAELIRVADGTRVWSKQYDRKAKDLFAIQDEIAAAVTQELVGRLLPSSKAALARRGTNDLQAYQDYIQGHQAMTRVSLDSLQRAEKLLQSAVARDPNYTAALLDLVQCWGGEYNAGAFGPDEFLRRATPVLDRVEVIDPGNARVLALRGYLAQARSDHELARTLIKRAVALAPDDYGIRIIAADFAAMTGDIEAELVHVDRMIALDPLNPLGFGQRATSLVVLGRLDEAETSARRALKLDPGNLVGMTAMAWAALARHDLAGGMAWMLKIYGSNIDPSAAVDIAMGLDSLQEYGAADAWMAESRRVQPQDNLYADQYDVQRLFLRHQDAAAIAASKRFIEAHRQDWDARWNDAVHYGCAAAARSGNLEQMRNTLVRDGFLPLKYDVSTLLAWSGKGETGRSRLNRIYIYSPCSFDASPADAPRRAGLRAAYEQVPPSASVEWKTTRDARLNNDRQTLAVVLARDEADSSWTFESMAVTYGVADDPRVQAQLRVLRSRETKARAELQGVLAREHLSMLPPKPAASAPPAR